jgi:hypothetical protein
MGLSHLRALAFTAVTFSAIGVHAGETPVSLCLADLRNAREQTTTSAPRSDTGCVRTTVLLEEAERKAEAAERRDDEEIKGMRSVASGTNSNQPRSTVNTQQVAPLPRADESDATEDALAQNNHAARPESQAGGRANPTTRSALETDAKQLEDAKKRAAIAAQKRRQLVAARRAAALRAARANAQQSGPGPQVSNPVPLFPVPRGIAPAAHSLP